MQVKIERMNGQLSILWWEAK